MFIENKDYKLYVYQLNSNMQHTHILKQSV